MRRGSQHIFGRADAGHCEANSNTQSRVLCPKCSIELCCRNEEPYFDACDARRRAGKSATGRRGQWSPRRAESSGAPSIMITRPGTLHATCVQSVTLWSEHQSITLAARKTSTPGEWFRRGVRREIRRMVPSRLRLAPGPGRGPGLRQQARLSIRRDRTDCGSGRRSVFFNRMDGARTAAMRSICSLAPR